MAPFVPTGYLTLDQAITLMAKAREPDLSSQVEAEHGEWKRLYQLQPFTTATRAYVLNFKVPGPGIGSSHAAAKPFTSEDRKRLETMESRQSRWADVQNHERTILRQALGDGALTGHGLTPLGSISVVPVEAWRTEDGERAMRGAKIEWWMGNPVFKIYADALLSSAEFQLWIGRTIAQATPKQERKDIPQDKINEWMSAATTEARNAGRFLKRDDAVQQCQKALGCSRPAARRAFTTLPPALKLNKGKPAETRPG